MAMTRTEIRFAGFGGQGVVLAGVLLGTAAVLRDGKHAVQTQSYGAAARGGAARSDVIISDEKIVYPQATAPDVMAVFTTEALNKYKSELKKDAIIIIDEDLVTLPENTSFRIPQAELVEAEDLVIPPENTSFRIYSVPATSIAANELGRGIVANMIMLGYLASLTGVVSIGALEETIRTSVPKGTEELNLTAFRKGIEKAREANNCHMK